MISDILGKKAEIINKILEKSGLNPEQVNKLIEEKKAEYGGLITDAGAAYSVAKNLGVMFETAPPKIEYTKLGEIAEKDAVSIIGKVMHVFPVREFEKDGRRGRVVNLTISDSTGSARLALWNEDVELVTQEKIRKGDVVEVQGGRVKKANGEIQISVGVSSLIQPAKDDGTFPQTKETLVKVSDVGQDMNEFEIVGRVIEAFPERTYEKEGKAGKMRSFNIADETGMIRVVAWNPSGLEDIREGDIVRIEGAYSKAGKSGVEIHVGWKGRAIINPEGLSVPETNFSHTTAKREFISDLEQDGEKEVRGTVMAVYNSVIKTCPNCFQKVEGKCDKCGSEGRDLQITSFELDDGSGLLRSVAFGSVGEGLEAGMEIIVRGKLRENEKAKRRELQAQYIGLPDPLKEAELLLGILKKQ
jgi:ssDNA-binding replication factor A large subunit